MTTLAQTNIRLVPRSEQVVNETASAIVENLAAAAADGNMDKVKSLIETLENPSDVNLYNKKGLTPLSLAAHFGHVEVVDYLLTVRADVDQPDFYGMTAIAYASEKGYTKVVQKLIKAGANLDWMDENNLGLSALHVAACKGQTEVTQILIEGGADINAQDLNGISVLHCAVGNGHEDVVECLLKANVKVNLQGSNTNRTPLFLAIDISNKKIVQMLLAHRAKTHLTDTYGLTPLAAACVQGKDDLAELLIKARANVNIADDKKCLPLHYVAGRAGKVHLTQKLLEAGSHVNVLNAHFESPLHVAVRSQDADIVNELIERGCNANICEPYSHVRALHVAVNTYSDVVLFEKVLSLLEKGGCDLNSRAFTSLESPLYRAINLNKEDIALVLLQHGADVNLDCPFEVTILQKACKKNQLDLVEAILHTDINWSREGWLQLDKYSSGYADLSLLEHYEENIPMALNNKIDLYIKILELQHNPMSLMRSCRRVLRNTLQSNLLHKLNTFYLPPKLVNFLLLKII